tara:strand:+ start:723 stop:1100 length:378 start_codon:yes stop_codon:yes gene_type:complete
MVMRIGEKVRSKLKEKTWTFQEISNVAEIITTMSSEMYDDLDVKSKVDLIWDVPIYEDMLFGEFFQGEVLRQLNNKIADIIKEELQTANVNFKDDDKDEVPKRSVGRKPPKKRTTNEKSDSKKQD